MRGARVIRLAFPRLAALALSTGALCAAGCGGEASPAPSFTYTLISDMEGDSSKIEWPPPPGSVAGSWFTVTDCSQHDRISPQPWEYDPEPRFYDALPEPHETMPGTSSAHAARLRTTSPLVGIWGASIGFSFGEPPPPDAEVPPDPGPPTDDAGACVNAVPTFPNPPVDLTPYAGVTFWARAESPGGRALRVQVFDVNTDIRGGICQGDACWNGFGVLLQLTDTFRRYTLDFSQFTQSAGWGYHPPDGIDWSRVFTMTFEMDLASCSASTLTMCAGGAPTLSFDVWIDDVYFVNK